MPNLNLKNFAKIQDSDFDIKDITVLAGKPGSGKSYVMKALFAVEESYRLTIDSHHKLTLDILDEQAILKKLLNDENFSLKTEKDIKTVLLGIKNTLLEQKKNEIDYIPEYDKGIPMIFQPIISNIFNGIFTNLQEISSDFEIQYNSISLKNQENILLSTIDVKDTNPVRNAIFVETPLILEFKQFMKREEGKTPYHIESLLNILDQDYSFTNNEQDEFIKSFVNKSRDIIQGNIENNGDSFIFKTNTKNFNIVNASSGIKSIGLLQYLVTNKALKKNSILFWEEPEVHLHPTWQLKMVDLFIELMNAGVKIIFSTHSPFMADYLNAKAQREKFSDRVSFNLLNEEENIVSNTILDDTNWNLLQNELLDPLEEIMWEYL